MSAQINLYHPRYLKQRDWLALGPIAALAGALYAVLALAAGWAAYDAAQRTATVAAADAQLQAVKVQVEAATAAAAARKPNPALQAEADAADALLRRREEIARLLESGAIGSTVGFAEHFRGLARQAPSGLWLTGVSIAMGGGDMEIRGSTLSAATLPDYIRRLGSEPAFRGKSFAALTMARPEVSAAGAVPPVPTSASPAAAAISASTSAPISAPTSASAPAAARAIDFVLLPKTEAAAPVPAGGAKP